MLERPPFFGLVAVLAALYACGDPADPVNGDGGAADVGFDADGGREPDAGSGSDLGVDPGGRVVPVGASFAPGTVVRDAYTGATAQVAEDRTVRLAPGPEGVVLLEAAGAVPLPFVWDNAIVYFVITDRFFNGDPSNDGAHGRSFDGMPTVGTFHGGDLKGIVDRLDHIEALGANALWITAPFEQVHGYVGGGGGRFPHFAYAGYWALDFTRLDGAFGTPDDLRSLVREAHQRGIRVVLDVVMNHPGYATLPEIDAYFPEALRRTDWRQWRPGPGEDWNRFNELFIDFDHPSWANWWGRDWVRAGLPGYDAPGSGDLRRSLASLPDFKTEAFFPTSGLPPMIAAKADTAATVQSGFTVRQYLIDWLTAWVREYGIDGFRCDTVKHVELDAWRELKSAGVAALRAFKEANPSEAIDDLDFWMVGEVFPHGVEKDAYYTEGGFDSLLNFEFQPRALELSRSPSALEPLHVRYASLINGDPEFNVLTYISSHDTYLFSDRAQGDLSRQRGVATALMSLPGGVQIFYGDETARAAGPNEGDDTAGTRSDMNWEGFDEATLAHWQRLGQFRRRHPAVAAGVHETLAQDAGVYVFRRSLERAGARDEVVIALFGP